MAFTSPHAVLKIVDRNPEIMAIHLFTPAMSLPIQADSRLTTSEQDLVQAALDLRQNTKLPFWDCLLQKISNSDVDTPTLFSRAIHHNSQRETIERVERAQLSEERLRSGIAAVPPTQMLALSSRVSCIGDVERHIPLIDFHCNVSAANDKRVREVVKSLGLRGYIAHSGQSYHFLGVHVVDHTAMLTILARALLFAPIVDRAWIAHQILEEACGLRLSPGKTYTECPIVIDEVTS